MKSTNYLVGFVHRVCDIELPKDHLAKNSLELLIDPFLDFLTGAMEEMTEIKILFTPIFGIT